MSKRTSYFVLISTLAVSLLAYGPSVSGQGGDDPGDSFFGSYMIAAERMDPSSLPFVGAWRMNFEKTDQRIAGSGRFDRTATTTFHVENGGLRHSVYNSYPPKMDNYLTEITPEARSYWFKLDGQNVYTDPQGPNGRGQTIGMWLIDSHTILRERATKGEIDERVLYRVSPDGQTLYWTRFDRIEQDSSHFAWDRIELGERPRGLPPVE